MKEVDYGEYDVPPFLPGWLSNGETKAVAQTFNELLKDVNEKSIELAQQYDVELVRNNPALLDRRGELLGISRNGMNDKTYFKMQNLRIKLNFNKSTLNDIIGLIKMFYDSENVHVTPNYPAGIRILHDGNGGKGVDFNQFIRETIGAGISFDTREGFKFDGDGVECGDEGGEIKFTHLNTFIYSGLHKYDGSRTYQGIEYVGEETHGF